MYENKTKNKRIKEKYFTMLALIRHSVIHLTFNYPADTF